MPDNERVLDLDWSKEVKHLDSVMEGTCCEWGGNVETRGGVELLIDFWNLILVIGGWKAGRLQMQG